MKIIIESKRTREIDGLLRCKEHVDTHETVGHTLTSVQLECILNECGLADFRPNDRLTIEFYVND